MELRDVIDVAPELRIERPGRGAYAFRVYAFGELGTYLSPALVSEIVDGLSDRIRATDAESLVAPEPGGHTWGLAVASRLGLPLRIIRSQKTVTGAAVPGAMPVDRHAAYYDDTLFVPAVPARERVVIVDDVVSSGGTLAAIVGHLVGRDVDVLGAEVILAKGDGYRSVETQWGIPVGRLVETGRDAFLRAARG